MEDASRYSGSCILSIVDVSRRGAPHRWRFRASELRESMADHYFDDR
jgi:hypothetical protein